MIELFRDHIMVKLVDPPTPPGLLIQLQGVDERAPKYAEVLGVGPGRVSEQGVAFPVPCKVGDTLLLNGMPGTPITVDGQAVRIILPQDCYGIVRP